ncbi:MAG: aminoglycoside phosphotransferase family protein [Pseudomonadota bacterium]
MSTTAEGVAAGRASPSASPTDAIAAGLATSLAAVDLDGPIEAMADTGLAHWHFRLAGRGLVARVPKQSQMQLAAEANLAYQAACYRRASASVHAPQLERVIAPTDRLPRGALIVQEIVGRIARLPGDLDAIATALAAIHALPRPQAKARAPLLAPEDPLGDLAAEIGTQAGFLDRAGVRGETRRILDRETAALAALAAETARPPVRLISFDAHPGNFIIDGAGRAVLVDLEKCRYSAPPLDLAHATLYTSTTWDVASYAVLSTEAVAETYRCWRAALGGADWAAEVAHWAVPMRRAMWLWSMTWCAKWRVLSGGVADATAEGEDWSAERSEDALIAHVRGRVDHYLAPETAERVAAEFPVLEQMLSD